MPLPVFTRQRALLIVHDERAAVMGDAGGITRGGPRRDRVLRENRGRVESGEDAAAV